LRLGARRFGTPEHIPSNLHLLTCRIDGFESTGRASKSNLHLCTRTSPRQGEGRRYKAGRAVESRPDAVAIIAVQAGRAVSDQTQRRMSC